MADVVRNLADDLSKPTSRRGFLGRLTKIAIVGTGAVAGVASLLLNDAAALAASCCSFGLPSCSSCPAGSSYSACCPGPACGGYNCCDTSNQYWGCQACCNTTNGLGVCGVSIRLEGCPQ
jgi:hypothetical protein